MIEVRLGKPVRTFLLIDHSLSHTKKVNTYL